MATPANVAYALVHPFFNSTLYTNGNILTSFLQRYCSFVRLAMGSPLFFSPVDYRGRKAAPEELVAAEGALLACIAETIPAGDLYLPTKYAPRYGPVSGLPVSELKHRVNEDTQLIGAGEYVEGCVPDCLLGFARDFSLRITPVIYADYGQTCIGSTFADKRSALTDVLREQSELQGRDMTNSVLLHANEIRVQPATLSEVLGLDF